MTAPAYSSDQTAPTAPSPKVAPSPGVAPSPSAAPSPARYAYLVGRLRGRQITMEEATELFELQQQLMVIRLRTPPPSPPSPSERVAAPAAPAGPPPSGMLTDDALWEAMPVLAAAAGVLAAVLKKSHEPAPAPPTPAPPAQPGRPRSR